MPHIRYRWYYTMDGAAVEEEVACIAVHKLRGALGELSVHHGCARSQSTDSGFVTESDSTSHDSAEAIMAADDRVTIPEQDEVEETRGQRVIAEDALSRRSDREQDNNEVIGLNRTVVEEEEDELSEDEERGLHMMLDDRIEQRACTDEDHDRTIADANTTLTTSHLCSQANSNQLNIVVRHGSKPDKLLATGRVDEEEEETQERCQSEPAVSAKGSLCARKLDLSLKVSPVNVTCSPRDAVSHSEASTHPAHGGSSKQSWLLRLFESKMFDMSIAITYLYNSKESGVQSYIGE